MPMYNVLLKIGISMKWTMFFPLLVVCSCADSLHEETIHIVQEPSFQEVTTDHHVSLNDIITLSKAKLKSTRASSDTIIDVDCITNKENDTLLYVVYKKNTKGWTIYSSDARVPACVAQCDSGTYEDLKKNEAAMVWIQTMADDIALIKTLSDEKLNFTKEQIENHKEFWKSVSSPDEYIKEKVFGKSTRVPDLPPLIPAGHYQLISTTFEYDTIYYVPRLTETNWHQNQPYNNYCPKRSDTTTGERAPAGCVAIAGAQMLYYLHYHLGVPVEAPSSAYCYGCVTEHPTYRWGQSDYSSTVWDDMALDGSEAAPLIANVGKRVSMTYRNDNSIAYTSDLVNLKSAT